MQSLVIHTSWTEYFLATSVNTACLLQQRNICSLFYCAYLTQLSIIHDVMYEAIIRSYPVYYNTLILDILCGRTENLFAPAWYVLSCFSCWASDGSFLHWWWMFTNIIGTLLIINLIVDSNCIDHFIILGWYLQWIKFGNGSICSYTTGSHFCWPYIATHHSLWLSSWSQPSSS